MNLQHVLKMFLFSASLLFSLQGLAIDTYNLEEFRQHYKKSPEPSSEKPQNNTSASITSPFNNIRIGFFGLNLTDDDVSGDDRLEIHDNFVIDPQNIEYLSDFYWHYVNTGDPQYQQARILKVFRLIFRIFTINMTTNTSLEIQQQITAMVKSLYEQVFLSETTSNNESNPYYAIMGSDQERDQSYYHNINNSFALMLFAFLGPYVHTLDSFPHYCDQLTRRISLSSYHQALSNGLMSGNMEDYESPQRFANQLTAANLNTETALLLGLSSMATAAQQYLDLGQSWPETLEELLQRFSPIVVLQDSYQNMEKLFHRPSCSVSSDIYSRQSTQEFIYHILGIYPGSSPESHSSQSYEPVQDNHVFREFSSDESSDDEGADNGGANGGANNETAQEAGAVGGVFSRVLSLVMYFSFKNQ
ncbi:hypothetical protein [Endozoicomonas sp. 4G]|uniref:hypothetical protein n=1 Tax=Endozoicomonas sp. 4G TaxID=2872754 RepID=UPI002078A33D|nr:hypothetical protein [Endozoicomonas sp. 4G]